MLLRKIRSIFIVKIGGITMDNLLQKYNDYIRLKNCRAEYLLSSGIIIDFTYKEENFIHLLGLHKLTDIQLIQLFNDKSNKKVQTKYIISRSELPRLIEVGASCFYHYCLETQNCITKSYTMSTSVERNAIRVRFG